MAPAIPTIETVFDDGDSDPTEPITVTQYDAAHQPDCGLHNVVLLEWELAEAVGRTDMPRAVPLAPTKSIVMA